jgi:hypothetical protein
MPWEQPLQQILQSVEGPVAKIIAVIIIIVTGLTRIGDTSGGFRGHPDRVRLSIIRRRASSVVPFGGGSGLMETANRCRASWLPSIARSPSRSCSPGAARGRDPQRTLAAALGRLRLDRGLRLPSAMPPRFGRPGDPLSMGSAGTRASPVI